MKKYFFLAICLVCMGLLKIQAQSLQSTKWKSLFAAPINDTAILTFNSDASVTITNSKGMELVRSIFHISKDTVSINDVEGPIACPDGAGFYKFTKSGNFLKLMIINDPCDGRANSLSGREWIKVANP
jgi:hypothetical protein